MRLVLIALALLSLPLVVFADMAPEGIGVFTALQTMGVPSRLLHFPDEGHWILKPANAQVWYDEILRWLKTHLGL